MATKHQEYAAAQQAILALQRGVPLVTLNGADFDLTNLNMLVAHRTALIQDLKRAGQWDGKASKPRAPTARTQADAAENLMRTAAKRQ
ncbi:MAG TPA: hypothetical protein VMN03_08090 [Burkholderiales bacterium]|nr:hypothetical protein [Burkholderiales bacterium]